MSFIDGLYARVRGAGKRIILPETDDPRVLEAARLMLDEQIAVPVFLAAPPQPVPGSLLVDDLVEREAALAECTAQLVERHRRKAMSAEEAAARLQQPLTLAAALLGAGHVDVGIAGSLATTGDVIRAGLSGVGLREDSRLVSSVFVMQFANKVLTYGDCAVMPEPDAAQLAQIAINAAHAHAALTGDTAKVAMLSFSTCGSAEHALVDKVREALALARAQAPELLIDGEFQYDTATVPEIGRRKAPDSAIAGQCNVLVYPDLNAGNIAYKIAQREGGARAMGPLLLGFAKPWMDLSRGCSSRDIVDLAVLSSLMA
ncbi:phosphate acetyltransferase [Mangrovimicrobium sediminis]|uniref:Phosphate acetyltransferase n=1 Tax=Mangrovimicrobium sediminis TaxID=2562682 RepID=A0A4Z0LWS1_9GAMM|nr:phosphate acyltransferase [Haliea sp. SAOS-164]TGD71515.1 phosphate acetyltransferase [Haliea sp. SAOS-164]